MEQPALCAAFAHIVFEATFSAGAVAAAGGSLGAALQGDGPVVVSAVLVDQSSLAGEGALQSLAGADRDTDLLAKKGLRPLLGDAVVAVNGHLCSHLNHIQVQPG